MPAISAFVISWACDGMVVNAISSAMIVMKYLVMAVTMSFISLP